MKGKKKVHTHSPPEKITDGFSTRFQRIMSKKRFAKND